MPPADEAALAGFVAGTATGRDPLVGALAGPLAAAPVAGAVDDVLVFGAVDAIGTGLASSGN